MTLFTDPLNYRVHNHFVIDINKFKGGRLLCDVCFIKDMLSYIVAVYRRQIDTQFSLLRASRR